MFQAPPNRLSQPYVQASTLHGVLPDATATAEPLHLFHTIRCFTPAITTTISHTITSTTTLDFTRNRKHVLHCYELLLMRALDSDPALWTRLCERFGWCAECEAAEGGAAPSPRHHHPAPSSTKDSFAVNSIHPDMWFLAVALKDSRDKLIHFIRAEGPKREAALPAKPLAAASFLSTYLSAFNFVELNLDSIFRYGEPSQLPAEIFRCPNVRTLSLRHNFLESLPPDLGRLARLERLFLTNNRLQNKSIPFTIAFLPNLQELYIDNNLLDALPGVLLRIASLERVHRCRSTLPS